MYAIRSYYGNIMSTCLITGANRGIGLEFCRQLKARGDSVIDISIMLVAFSIFGGKGLPDNAGGKSVCLKTTGLLQYMLQCGLLIPVNDGSKTGIFDQLFIDIGDEQSLENDLSTYSSHLMNMKHFVVITSYSIHYTKLYDSGRFRATAHHQYR